MPAFMSPYGSPFARLVANVQEDGDCWLGSERSSGRGGYLQVNFRVPGLGYRIVKFSAHVLTYIAHVTGFTSMDDLFLAYLEFRCSGLELDHGCYEPACRRPDHLEPVTHAENCQRRRGRQSPIVSYDPDEVEF